MAIDFRKALMFCTTALSVTAPLHAFALPQDGTVVAGQATITSQGKQLDITQSTNKAIIDWRGFDIAPDESTRFNQPSADALTLNRVRSTNASRIDGMLSANGNIVIVNPNGVVFGKTARVDVGSLTATTSDIDNDRFMHDAKPVFNKPGSADGRIVNQGTITAREAGLVGLVAPQVENSGLISARLGKVTLASGDTFTLDLAGDGITQIAVTGDMNEQIVRNSGTIEADGGNILLTAAAARDAVNSLIENTGTLRANTIGEHEGKIVLYAEGSHAVIGNDTAQKDIRTGRSRVVNTGVIEAKGANPGEKGGIVQLLADEVVMDGRIDISGDIGGGVANIGGDFHGEGVVATSMLTVIGDHAIIKADSFSTGDGGKVSVWSDDRTEFGGTIEADALGNSGNGGYVETSGKVALIVTGNVTATSRRGRSGTWLLDPADITITTSDNNISAGPSYTATGTGSTIAASTIKGVLDGGTNVTITTTNDAFAGNGDITVSSAIITTGSGALTLSAYRDINVNAGITLQGGALTLRSNNAGAGSGAVKVAAAIATNGGKITIGGGSGAITAAVLNTDGTVATAASGFAMGDAQQAAGVAITAGIDAGGGDIIINGQGLNTTTNSNIGVSVGALVKTSNNGTITISGTGAGNTNSASDAGVLVSAGGVQTANGAINIVGIGGGGTGTGSANHGVSLTMLNALKTSNGGKITVNGLGGSGTGAASHGVNISSGSIVGSGGAIAVVGTSVAFTVAGSSNTGITITGATALISNTGAGSIMLNGMGGGSLASAHGVAIISGGKLTTDTGTIDVTGVGGRTASNGKFGISLSASSITSNSGAITLTGTGANSGSNNHGIQLTNGVNINTAGNITLNATGMGSSNIAINTTGTTSTIGSSSTTGTITLNQIGTINVGDIELTAATVTTAASGTIAITGRSGGTVGIGTTAGSNNLNLTDTELANLSSGNYIFGSTASAAMTINTARNFADGNVTFLSGTDISLAAALSKTSGGAATYTFRAYGNISNTSGIGISSSTGALSLVLDSDYDNNATGTITLNGNTTLSTNGGSITLNDATLITGNLALTSANGAITLNGALTADANGTRDVTISGGTGTFTAAAMGTSGNRLHDLSITADDVVLNGDMYGSGNLVLQPTSTTRIIRVADGNSGDFNLNATEIGHIQNGWNSIAVGRLDTNADMNIGTSSWADPISFRSVYRRNVIAGSTLTTTDNATLSLTSGGWVNVYGTINADGAYNSSAATTFLQAGGSINTTNDDITFGTVGSPGTINAGSGTVTFNGTVGNDTPNLDLTVSGGSIVFNSTFLTSGTAIRNISLTSTNGITLPSMSAAGSILVRTTGAAADITLSSGTTITAGGTGNALTLAAGRNFINSSSSSALSAASGRWLVYSADPVNNTRGGLMPDASDFNKTYAGNAPGTIGAGNRLIYSRSTAYTIALDVNNDSVTYGDSYTPNPGYSYVSGLVAGDTFSGIGITGSASYATTYVAGTTNASATAYTDMITATTGTLASKLGYQFTFTGGDLTVNKRTITPTLTGTVSKVYDGTATATIGAGNYSYSNIYGSDDVFVSNTSGSYNDKNVGTGKLVSLTGLTLGGAKASNYQLAGSTLSGNVGTVTAKALTVTGITTNDKVYDGTATAALVGTAVLSGKVAGDTVTFSTASAAGSFADKNVGNGKTVTFAGYSISGTDAGNYTLSQPASTTANITPKALTLTGITTSGKVYDGTAVATLTGTAALSGNIVGDSLTIDATGATGTFNNKNVGTGKTVTLAGYVVTGTDASNYTFSQPTSLTANITAKALTLTGISTGDKIYDGNTTATLTGTAALSGNIVGDSLTIDATGATGTFNNKNVGNGKTVTLAGYVVTGTDASNYTFSQPSSLTANITPKALTVTGVTTSDKVYNGNAAAVLAGTAVLSGKIAGDALTLSTAGATGTFADKNVGNNKTVTLAGYSVSGGDAGNYTFSQPASLTANITPKALTLTGVTATGKVYDGTTLATLNGTAALSGNIVGDSLTIDATSATGTFNNKNVGTGKTVTISGYAITGTDASNYTFSQPASVTANITAKALTVTGISADDKIYDGNAIATLTGTAGLSGDIAGDALTLSSTSAAASFANATAATNKTVTVTGYSISGSDASNYTFTQPTGLTADIAKKDLNITAASQSVTYGTSVPTTTLSYSGFITGETVSVLSGTPTVASTLSGIQNAGSYTGNYTVSGGSATNYTLHYIAGDLTVTKKQLNVTAANQSVTYGTSVPTGSFAYNGFITGETASVIDSAPVLASAQSGVANAGTYTGNYTVSGGSDNNYSFNYIAGDLTVNKKGLNATVSNQSITYGDAIPTATIVYTGFIAGDDESDIDTLASVHSAQSGAVNAGTYTGNYTASGAADANYSFNYMAGNLTVAKKQLNVTANSQSVTYGTNVPTTTLSYSGFITGETASVLDTAPHATSTRSGIVDAGTYSGNYGATGGVDNNYSFTYVDGTLTVTKKTIIASANDMSVTYGTAVPTGTISYVGLISGDTAASIDTAPTLVSARSGIQNAGTYANNFTLSGASDSNYNFTYASGKLIVNRKALTITADDASRNAGDPNPVFTASYSGLVAGDTSAVVTGLSITSNGSISSPGGTYSIIPHGGSAVNYSLSYVNGVLTIIGGNAPPPPPPPVDDTVLQDSIPPIVDLPRRVKDASDTTLPLVATTQSPLTVWQSGSLLPLIESDFDLLLPMFKLQDCETCSRI